jgi:hypothetical protein
MKSARSIHQARAIVRMADILSRVLLPADVALALAGLATARSRRRALLALVIPVAALGALGALGIRLLTHTGGSPLVTAAASALTAPLTTDLETTTAICAIVGAVLLVAPRLSRLKTDRDLAGRDRESQPAKLGLAFSVHQQQENEE